jgi:hypothetical protein
MKLSILDYVPIFENRNATDALNHSIELAQLAEKLGYERYWVAEHHQVLSVASSAPEMKQRNGVTTWGQTSLSIIKKI